MTDAEIVKVLAERDGFIPLAFAKPLDYLSDRNALASVIGKMTKEEQGILCVLQWDEFAKRPIGTQLTIWLLTCDPRVIAGCIAKAIQKGKA